MHNENFRIKRATLEYEAIAFKLCGYIGGSLM